MFDKKFNFAWWLIPITYLVVACLFKIALSLTQLDIVIWKHLGEFLIVAAIFNTISIWLAVSFFTLMLGVFLAWTVCKYDFAGRSFFVGALVLPLTIPAYIMAIVYIGVFDYSGVLQTFLRKLLKTDALLLEIRTWWGLVMVLTLSLYPYVYLLAKNAFLSQDKNLIDAAKVLGASDTRTFFKAALPMAYPWLAASMYLVGMETLSDFGSFSFFGIDNLTTLVYQAWFDLTDYQLALQISAILLLTALLIILLPNFYAKDYRQFTSKDHKKNLIKLTGKKSLALSSLFGLVFFCGFIFPVTVLIVWGLEFLNTEFNLKSYVKLFSNSLLTAFLSAALVSCLAIVMALTKRIQNSKANRFFLHIINTSYALPSSVLAAGIFAAFINIDFYIAKIFGLESVLIYSVLGMVLILSQRFLSPAFYNLDSALKRIPLNQEAAAATLGMKKARVFFNIHLPLLKKVLLVGFLVVVIDTAKELPITLISRPYGFNTLAIEVFELTSAGMLKKSALPSLGIILLGAITIMLIHQLTKPKKTYEHANRQ